MQNYDREMKMVCSVFIVKNVRKRNVNLPKNQAFSWHKIIISAISGDVTDFVMEEILSIVIIINSNNVVTHFSFSSYSSSFSCFMWKYSCPFRSWAMFSQSQSSGGRRPRGEIRLTHSYCSRVVHILYPHFQSQPEHRGILLRRREPNMLHGTWPHPWHRITSAGTFTNSTDLTFRLDATRSEASAETTTTTTTIKRSVSVRVAKVSVAGVTARAGTVSSS